MRPMLVDVLPIDVGEHDFLSIHRGSRKNLAVWSCDKTLSPKLDPFTAGWRLVTDPIRNSNITAIGNRVAALDRFPRGVLRLAEFLFLRRMPSDRRGIKNDLCAVERSEPRRL